MWSRQNIAGALAFAALAVAAPFLPSWLVSLATIAFANGLVVLGLGILWRGRRGAVRAGAVLRGGRLYGGAHEPLHRLARRLRAGGGRRARGRSRGFPDRPSAGALPRHLLRDAQPRDVDDPLRRAGEDRHARLDRRHPS